LNCGQPQAKEICVERVEVWWWDVEVIVMRKMMMALAVMVMLAGGRAVYAQIGDPSTGLTVDSNDATDLIAVENGEPGNGAAEMNAILSEREEAQNEADFEAQSLNPALPTDSGTDDDAQTSVAIPATPKPVMLPKGGTYKAAELPVMVKLSDQLGTATMYYTTDGSKPTVNSAVYAGLIAVSSKETIKVMAVEDGSSWSGVVTKKFKVKK
jgi:hypothetical protein